MTELLLAILIWNRKLRTWALLVGVLLHLSIDFWILVGFFSYAMFCGYIAFTPSETATRWILAARNQVMRVRGGSQATARHSLATRNQALEPLTTT